MPESEIVFACDEQQATIRQGTIDGSHIMIDWLRANAPKEIQDAYFADSFLDMVYSYDSKRYTEPGLNEALKAARKLARIKNHLLKIEAIEA